MHRFFPFLIWWPLLKQRGVLRADVLAGLTGAVVVLPQGVAFATLAGMPPEYGLYSAMVPCVIAALLGSSRVMVTGPANAISLTILAIMAPLAAPGSDRYVALVLTLTFMVGVWQLLLGLARAGKLTQHISHTVIVGFTAGAAVLIINSQIRNFFGVDISRGANVWQTAREFFGLLGSINPGTVIVGVSTLVAATLWKPLNRWVPAMLIAVIVGAMVAAIAKGAQPDWMIKTVDALPGALPRLSTPELSLDTLKLLLIPSLAMTLLALAEAVSIAQAMAKKRNEPLDGNQEFLGQGAANMIGSFFSAYPSSGSFNRSGVNLAAGAVTPFSAICAAVFLVLILFFVAPLATYLPLAAVAAILFLVAWGLIDRREIRHLLDDKFERITLIATFVATLTMPLEWAILLGVAVSLVVARVKRR
ncbi:MAG: SulP family inorganic anion transporter [Betaproteobacteria bacterium]|nr:MAG: SulP family inorganic anion transporter [Betaproteobacteria bacterium]